MRNTTINNRQKQEPDPNQNQNELPTQPIDNDLEAAEEPREINVNPPVQAEIQDETSRIRTLLMDLYAAASITPFEDRYTFRKPGKNMKMKLKKL